MEDKDSSLSKQVRVIDMLLCAADRILIKIPCLHAERADFGRGAQAAKPLVGSRQQARGALMRCYYELLLFTSRARVI